MDPLQEAITKYRAKLSRLGERAGQVTPEMRESFFRRETAGQFGFEDARALIEPAPEKKDVGAVDYLRAGGMGASMGTLDELVGAGAAIVPGGRDYTEGRDKVRQDYQAAKDAAPKRMLAAELGGLPPTTEALYDDPKVVKAFPFAEVLRESIDSAAPRPVTPAYSDISLAIQKTFHPPDGVEANGIVEQLKDRMEKAADGAIF